MKEFRLPPIQSVIDLHTEWIAEYGGASGVRDKGAFEGSPGRASQLTAYDPDASLAVVAAAVCVSICRNHPFVDGNKRAAFGTMGVILGLNGCYLDVAEQEATRVMVALAAGEMSEDEFRAWVSTNILPDE
ncbi:type II toxin-antitoxin system death-on-curing family toxin [Telmatospirillum sp.]|uniref:type II toxin-antitoxin system death-on-curing family toxin n=1 Tax=Telmatospirillum sp. TaxID=2079197 RepID=UPI00283B80C8|nr:type II toxin-antitoxin system death-on-curing family toxin [Telmatospirillum sp.]MDR3440948.1 type II toxin-antitoxin system death-on-curing family toxin [Telmatospirillum sp.]